VLAPIDFTRLETAFADRHGWIELAIIAACMGVGWVVDRRFRIRTEDRTDVVRMGLGGVNRLIFPLTTLALLIVAYYVSRRFVPPFFFAIAIPMLVALAAIRLVVYALRGMFGGAAWLRSSERAIGFTIWGFAILYFVGVLPEVGAELDAIEIPLGSTPTSLLTIGKGALVVLLTLVVTLWLSGLIERRLMRSRLDQSVRVVMAKVVHAVMIAVGVLIALRAIGFDLTLLSVFGGALGVGIGLGLQKLAANYIAGFTMLLDRSIRMGDLITVDNRFGVVSKVTSRYVVVRSLDGIDAIVPNETLVTTTVLNHSYSNNEIRVGVPVQISYDSDVDQALALMKEAAQRESRVLKAPNPPAAFLVGFGESAINLELGVWINDPENGQLDLRSTLNQTIWQAFREHGIRIPFPQREYRVVNVPGASAGPVGDAPSASPKSGG
jgi:small-conductance mechanosensitive channel